MNRFDVSTKTSKVATSIAVGILGGGAIAFIGYYLLSRFPNSIPPSTSMSLCLGVGAVVAVATVLNTLFSTVKRVRVDGQGVHLEMLMGGTKAYPHQGNTFEPMIVHNAQSGRSVRSLRVLGAHGQTAHRLDIEPGEFSELITILTGSVPVGAMGGPTGHPHGQAAARPIGPQGPLQFQPRTFSLDPARATRKRTLPLAIVGSLLILAGLAALVISITQGEAGVGGILLAFLGLLGLLFFLTPLILWVRSRPIPRTVVVAPTSVTFGDRTFVYAECKVIQIKPAGASMERSAKILTTADERVIVPLGLDNYVKVFPNYDEFATLLHEAGTAAAGVIRIDYS